MRIILTIIIWIGSILIAISGCNQIDSVNSNPPKTHPLATRLSSFLLERNVEFSNATLIFVPSANCLACNMHAMEALKELKDAKLILIRPWNNECPESLMESAGMCVEYSSIEKREYGLSNSHSISFKYCEGVLQEIRPLI